MQENKFNESFENNENNSSEFKTKIFDRDLNEVLNDNKVDEQSDDLKETVKENEKLKTKTKSKKNKKKKKIPAYVSVLIILLISVILASTIILTAIEFLGITFSPEREVTIEIARGLSTEQIANILEENDLINSPLMFRMYAKLKNVEGTFKYGVYDFKTTQGYSSIIRELQSEGEVGDVVNITIPEGYSLEQIGDLLEKKGICTKREFIDASKNYSSDYDFVKDIPSEKVYYKLEGYLYPDTYQVYANTNGKNGAECANRVIRKMLEKTNSVLTDEIKAEAKKKGYTIHQILTLASIIEKEASSSVSDMPKVAQVFYNRLRWKDQPPLLGSTPTADYPDSRYDTNKHEGLPPGPVCGPSENAIKAALNPDTSVKANYFVTDSNMKFYYTNTYSEHTALIERLKSEGIWN